jgi:prevent-host-death family protein
MTTVGSYDAKTHLPQLLDRVARGEKILITKHGQAVAMLVPPADDDQMLDAREVIKAMRELRRGNSLGEGLTIRNLINEGRRF